MGQKIIPCLWFDHNAGEAIAFYGGIFDDVRITEQDNYLDDTHGKTGSPMYYEFTMNGCEFSAINGGPEFKFTEAISLMVDCKDQAEIDYFWDKLGEGGEHGPCGWLKDKYGLSWQIVPRRLNELYRDENPVKAKAALDAMMQMGKIDIAALEAAAANA